MHYANTGDLADYSKWELIGGGEPAECPWEKTGFSKKKDRVCKGMIAKAHFSCFKMFKPPSGDASIRIMAL